MAAAPGRRCFIMILRPGRVIAHRDASLPARLRRRVRDSHAGREQRGASRRVGGRTAGGGSLVVAQNTAGAASPPLSNWSCCWRSRPCRLTYLPRVHDAITDLQHGGQSQASSAAYYRPLIGFLERQPGIWRVEVPFTADHWEAYYLAPHVPLARGWERQTDIADNPLFYDGRLTPITYDAWLHQLAVHYVAVADAPPDYAARAELRLIRRGLPYLHVVARLAHWTVYAVDRPTAVASGAGQLVFMGPNSLTVAVAHPGLVRLRVRWSPYWRLSGVGGCVAPDRHVHTAAGARRVGRRAGVGQLPRLHESTHGAARAVQLSGSRARLRCAEHWLHVASGISPTGRSTSRARCRCSRLPTPATSSCGVWSASPVLGRSLTPAGSSGWSARCTSSSSRIFSAG